MLAFVTNIGLANQSPTRLEIIFGLPAIAMLWILLFWNPKRRRQWYLAAGRMIYVGFYYWVFLRHHT